MKHEDMKVFCLLILFMLFYTVLMISKTITIWFVVETILFFGTGTLIIESIGKIKKPTEEI